MNVVPMRATYKCPHDFTTYKLYLPRSILAFTFIFGLVFVFFGIVSLGLLKIKRIKMWWKDNKFVQVSKGKILSEGFYDNFSMSNVYLTHFWVLNIFCFIAKAIITMRTEGALRKGSQPKLIFIQEFLIVKNMENRVV